MDGFELLDADLGVNGGRFELFIAEELLNETDARFATNPALVEAVASSRSAAGRDSSPPLPGLFHLGSHYCRNCPDP